MNHLKMQILIWSSLLGVGLALVLLCKLFVSTLGVFSVTSTFEGDLDGESPPAVTEEETG